MAGRIYLYTWKVDVQHATAYRVLRRCCVLEGSCCKFSAWHFPSKVHAWSTRLSVHHSKSGAMPSLPKKVTSKHILSLFNWNIHIDFCNSGRIQNSNRNIRYCQIFRTKLYSIWSPQPFRSQRVLKGNFFFPKPFRVPEILCCRCILSECGKWKGGKKRRHEILYKEITSWTGCLSFFSRAACLLVSGLPLTTSQGVTANIPIFGIFALLHDWTILETHWTYYAISP